MTIANRIRLTAGSGADPLAAGRLRRLRLPAASGGTIAVVGPGALASLAGHAGGRRIVVVGDRRALALHAPRLEAALAVRPLGWIRLPRGERAKRVAILERTWRALARLGVRRGDRLVAVGGGAALDLAGLAASTWMRGIDWIAVPTTLLAAADACLGGKTAVDLPEAKNAVGTFHPPRAAVVDPALLATLARPALAAARYEILKCAWIGDPALARIAADPALVDAEPAAVTAAVWRALRVKARLVRRDPRERGVRRLLNLGHTFAHAVETASGFRVAHGDAVGLGLAAAVEAALALGRIDAARGRRLLGELRALGRPRVGRFSLSRAVAAARLDKKRRGAGLVLVLPGRRGVGTAAGVGLRLFARSLERAGAEPSGGPGLAARQGA